MEGKKQVVEVEATMEEVEAVVMASKVVAKKCREWPLWQSSNGWERRKEVI